MRVLDLFGFAESSNTVDALTEPNRVFVMGVIPVRIDPLTDPSGFNFTDCYGRRLTVELDGVQVAIISLADLKANKLASGRKKDISDVEHWPTA